MPINFEIPKNARLIPLSVVFTAPFNATVPGKYDFTGTAANRNVLAMSMQVNSVYIIDTISISGNVSEEQFLESISTFPNLIINKNREMLYYSKIPISNYFKSSNMAAFFRSDKNNENMFFTVEGVFNQTPEMVGVSTMKIQVSMNIFSVESRYFQENYLAELTPHTGYRLRS